MLELPEAKVISQQLNQTIQGKKIEKTTAAQTAHKLTWYKGDPQKYPEMLSGKTIGISCGLGALVTVQAANSTLVFSDGVNLRFHTAGESRPVRHQLLIEFSDSSALSAVVQMYGGIVCFTDNDYDNPYYKAALVKAAALSPAFTNSYFDGLISSPAVQKLSLKAFLATEQRIPGLGNGVLQDILFNARMHPRKKTSTLNDTERESLYKSVVKTLIGNGAAGRKRHREGSLRQFGGIYHQIE